MSIAPTQQASTVLLVRDAPDAEGGVEVFMEKRSAQSGFIGGAYVFPGGRVDPADIIDPARCTALDETTANRRLNLESGGMAHYVAAIRECFEEAGVLLAYDRSGAILDFGDPAVEHHFGRLRKQLNAGTITIQTIAEQEDLRLATDRIAYWSHWITPTDQPKRFDTRFFVTRAPEGQLAGHDDWELTSSAWVTPKEAIARAHRREWMIIFPTLRNLETLGRHDTADAAVAWAAAQPQPLPAILPKVFRGRVVLPGDEGYDLADADTSTLNPAERRFMP